jgi:hypothetical protein
MEHLLNLEAASRYRQLARFYGEAVQISVTPLTKTHYRHLCGLCERLAYQLEQDALARSESAGAIDALALG